MSSVIVCGYNENETPAHIEALRASGHRIVTSQGLRETFDPHEKQECQLLVLGLDAIHVEDAGQWALVEKLATRAPVIGLRQSLSEDICRAAAHAHIALLLPNSTPKEVFLYAAEQLLRQNCAELVNGAAY